MNFAKMVEMLTAITMVGRAASEIPKVVDLREQMENAATAQAAEIISTHAEALERAAAASVEIPCPITPTNPGIPPIEMSCTLNADGVMTMRHPSETLLPEGVEPPKLPPSPTFVILDRTTTTLGGGDPKSAGRDAHVVMVTSPVLPEALLQMSMFLGENRQAATECLMNGMTLPNGQATMRLNIIDATGNTHSVPISPSVHACLFPIEIPDATARADAATIAADSGVFILDSAGHQIGTLPKFLAELAQFSTDEVDPMGISLTGLMTFPPELIANTEPVTPKPILSYRGPIPTATPPAPKEITPYDRIRASEQAKVDTNDMTIALQFPTGESSSFAVKWIDTDAGAEGADQAVQTLRFSDNPAEIRSAIHDLRGRNNINPALKWFLELIRQVPPNKVEVYGSTPETTTIDTGIAITQPKIIPCGKGLCIVGLDATSHRTAAAYLDKTTLQIILKSPNSFFGLSSRDEITHAPADASRYREIFLALAQAVVDGKEARAYLHRPEIPLAPYTNEAELRSALAVSGQNMQMENTTINILAQVKTPGPDGVPHDLIIPLLDGTEITILGVTDGAVRVRVKPLDQGDAIRQFCASHNLECPPQVFEGIISPDYLIPAPATPQTGESVRFQPHASQHTVMPDMPRVIQALTHPGYVRPGQTIAVEITPAPIEIAVHRILDGLARELPRDSGQRWIAAQKARMQHSRHA